MALNFFKRKGPFGLKTLFPNQSINIKIKDIKSLDKANKLEITFLDSTKYRDLAQKTKAGCCITTHQYKKYLPSTCHVIIVKNVLVELANVTKKFYSDADVDFPDPSLKKPNKLKYPGVKFGNNVLVGKNVKIGKNSTIGNYTIIEQNVSLGKNCVVNSHVMIKNSLISDNVVIQSGCKIGLKGFGFIPLKNKNIKFPHIGRVILEKNVEIASSCTIDRGSIDDTIIGENTYLDNQVHVAHNVKIGKNCIITGQVGFAGSSSIGNKVMIGGQAGISGHLTIGDNVQIGGGSGVIKNIPSNTKVMGYPAKNIRRFLKENKIND